MMRRKLIILWVVYLCVLISSSFFIWNRYSNEIERLEYHQYTVDLNEISNLSEQGNRQGVSEAIQKIQGNIQDRQADSPVGKMKFFFLGWNVLSILLISLLFFYLYKRLVRPFEKLQEFAAKVAGGDLDIQLEYDKGNAFGEFTWAFDHMRTEIKRARQREKEAIENHKTVIATLSHDIKTPLASVRTYAEGLEANMDTTLERREKYIAVILRRCDEVTKLTDDLLLHSLSDLDKLCIETEPMEIVPFLQYNLREHQVQGIPLQASVMADEKRLAQVLENIISNAEKYANTHTLRWYTRKEDEYYVIGFRDHGKGIPDADMPFVLGKFYRGKNIGNQAGAGLGLFIVDYVMTQMGGKVVLENTEDGLQTELFLKTS